MLSITQDGPAEMKMEINKQIIQASKMLTQHEKQKNLVEVHLYSFLYQGARAIVEYVNQGKQVTLARSTG